MLKTIKEYLPLTNVKSIFSAFDNPVWAVVLPDSTELDRYFYLRYGDRVGNKFIENYVDTNGIVTGDNLNNLAKLIYDINAKRWEHLFGAYMAEYNPIENTDFIETITDTNTNVKTVTGSTTSNGTATTTSNATTTGTNSNSNGVFGFDSVDSVGDTENSGSDSNTTNATSTTTTGGGTTENNNIADNGSHTSEHRKHGNIGVTENVTMLQSEISFWWKWSFVDYICQDICDLIALSIYN